MTIENSFVYVPVSAGQKDLLTELCGICETFSCEFFCRGSNRCFKLLCHGEETLYRQLFADADMQCPEPGHSVLQEQELGAAHLRGILIGTGRGRDGQTQGKKRHEQQACAYAFHGSLLRRWIGCLLGAS